MDPKVPAENLSHTEYSLPVEWLEYARLRLGCVAELGLRWVERLWMAAFLRRESLGGSYIGHYCPYLWRAHHLRCLLALIVVMIRPLITFICFSISLVAPRFLLIRAVGSPHLRTG